MNWIRLAPVTAEAIIVCAVIYAGCKLQANLNHDRFVDVQREWGAIHSLQLFDSVNGFSRADDPELFGPFDVWDGDSWRIPMTVIHHGELLHLVVILGAAWYLGSRLERHWGSLAMGVFLLPAACIPVMAELAIGQAMIGFSGIVCAMLGALVVLRRFHDDVAGDFPIEAAEIGMSIIALCWLASLAGLVSIPNVAHLTGFIYGASIAFVLGGPLEGAMNRFRTRHGNPSDAANFPVINDSMRATRISANSQRSRLTGDQSRSSVSRRYPRYGRDRSWGRFFVLATVILAHLWLIPGLIVICHPVWLARYHWYQAIATRHPSRSERSLQQAVLHDPSLTGVWIRWSRLAETRGEMAEAWERLINGLVRNPSSDSLIEGVQRLWRHLDSQQRKDAELAVTRVFGSSANLWLDQIRSGAKMPELKYNEEVSILDEKLDTSQFSLDQKINLDLIEKPPAQSKTQAPLIPVDENDALEGKSL